MGKTKRKGGRKKLEFGGIQRDNDNVGGHGKKEELDR